MRWVVAVLAAAVVVLVGLGSYVADRQGRWSNLKANLPSEMVGLVMSVAVAVLVVDWIVDWHRRREWRVTRRHLSNAVIRHIVDIASEYYLFLHGLHDRSAREAIVAGRNSLAAETPERLARLVAELRGLAPDDHRTAACELYDEVRWDLERLSSLLLLMELLVRDVEFAEAMTQLDAAAADWHNAVIAERRAAVGGVLNSATAFLEAAKDVYAVVLKSSD